MPVAGVTVSHVALVVAVHATLASTMRAKVLLVADACLVSGLSLSVPPGSWVIVLVTVRPPPVRVMVPVRVAVVGFAA